MSRHDTYNPWIEYDIAAKWCARRGLTGKTGDPLPDGLGGPCHDLINADPEAFERRVRETAYMLARERSEVTP